MPRPLIPEYPERSKCRAMLCQNDGTKACSRCKTKYCSAKCQQSDWKYHKTYCGKMVYTFKFKLLGSRDPVITRTVDVPAWWSFQQLHFVIQYAFGPWEQCHLHEFSYSTSKPNNSGIISLAPDQTVLKICSGDGAPQSMFGEPVPKFFFEKEIMLKDIYDVKGKHRSLVESASDGNLLPLVYLYDFGDHWEHLITFKGEKLAKADRPLFSKAKGYPPAEDAGGVTGWERVKDAFRATRPTRDQLERRQWAIQRMHYDERERWKKDPLAVDEKPYSPFNEVNVMVMNYEGRWENHLRGYMTDLGEYVSEDEGDDDDF